MKYNVFPYSAAALSLVLAGMCWALPVRAGEDASSSENPAAVREAQPAEAQDENSAAEDKEIVITGVEKKSIDDLGEPEQSGKSSAELDRQALPGDFEITFKNEGDYVIEPDSMAYHQFTTFIYNDFAHFLRTDPRVVSVCTGNTEKIDLSQKLNEHFTDEADLADVKDIVFKRIVGLDRGFPGREAEADDGLPTIKLLGVNNNILYKRVKMWSSRSFEGYREEYMKPYRVGEFRFDKKYRAQVRERRGNSLRGWTKKMSVSDLSLCAAYTPIAIFMDTDEKRTRNRNAWMPTLMDDFMYYSSKHSFPYVGFMDYKLKFLDENGAEIEPGSGKPMPAKNGRIICSWDKLILFELDDIIKADRN